MDGSYENESGEGEENTIGNIGEDFEPAQGITESSDVSENVEQTL